MTALKTTHKHEQVEDIYYLDPRDIALQDEELRGRKFPPSKSDVKKLAESIMRGGQEQPIKCRIDKETGKPILVFGRTRWEAVTLINEELDPKNPKKIAVRIVEQDEKEAFISANEENLQRKATTAVDEAFNHEVMRKRFGMADVEIAEKCGISQAWVSKLKKLVSLDKDVLVQVHAGNITVSSAISMADLDAEKQKKIAEGAKEAADKANAASNAKGTVKKAGSRPAREVSTSTRAAVRAAKNTKARKAGSEVDHVQSRSVKEVRTFMTGLKEAYHESEPLKDFATSADKYLSGKITDRQFENAILKLAQCGMKKVPEKTSAVEWE